MQSLIGERFLKKFAGLIKTYRKLLTTNNDLNTTVRLGEDQQEITNLKQVSPEPQKESPSLSQERRNNWE